jgi:hypothetical protein
MNNTTHQTNTTSRDATPVLRARSIAPNKYYAHAGRLIQSQAVYSYLIRQVMLAPGPYTTRACVSGVEARIPGIVPHHHHDDDAAPMCMCGPPPLPPRPCPPRPSLRSSP